jgi:superfamily I DNA/RNA helicase/mRNA-degrading endonuclease RelE of RelBE toxin-antitoxin system
MDFRIADTFIDSLAKLTGDEQKAIKTTAFDLQTNPASPGMQFHKLDKAKDKHFWSVRVGSDLRLIVHRTEAGLLLCYVGHHDKAYEWAERRRIEVHPTTGAAQIVEVRETIKEVVVPRYVETEIARPKSPPRPLFADVSDKDLLAYGVPADWLPDVRAATEDSILTVADHLPAEAAEALLELATGGEPQPPAKPETSATGFEHPDAQRRFRIMANAEELERALEFPWEKWTIFLHPAQREWVERDYAGPARVSGSAGTGKTIVALHRAAFLARKNPEARVLLATFSDTLANALRTRLKRLLSNEPRLGERIDVYGLTSLGRRLFKLHAGRDADLVTRAALHDIVRASAAAVDGHKFGHAFLMAEWDHVVDGWQLDSWEGYRDVARLGRKTRLSEGQRKTLWAIFEKVRKQLASQKAVTEAQLFAQLAEKLVQAKRAPFDFAIVDEAQDLGIGHLRFLAALGAKKANALFFAGDLGQRIFQQPYSWKTIGVDVRGRSRTLRVNYRTSHQIRRQADRLLDVEATDIDGNKEKRNNTVSVFNGPPPTVLVADTQSAEWKDVGDWLADKATRWGLLPHELGLFVRSEAELGRAKSAVKHAGYDFKLLDEHVETVSGFVSIGTMHLAKGLEFRGVAVMACDDEVIPSQERIETVGDEGDLQEVYDTERQLLYVACTRARDHLLVSGVKPASEFLDDLGSKSDGGASRR